MAWLIRNGRPYYYRSRRIGTRVLSEYVGPGLPGILAEEEDQEQRLKRQTEREQQRQELERLKALDLRLAELHEALTTTIRGMLYVHGYVRHQRGEWRKPAASIRA